MEEHSYQLIDGKAVAEQIKKELAAEVEKIKQDGRKAPHLVAILVGHDGGSEAYVANKVRNCEEAIDYRKDVDGFHPINVGRMSIGLPCFKPATPAGIIELLRHYEIPTKGKHCVILGRSNIVGKPMAMLMMQKDNPGDCTVTVCHSRSENLREMCLSADIIIAALGVPEFLKGDMVKEGAVVIDVGTTRVPSSVTKSGYRLMGDVAFHEVAPKCSYITPVPGGVGPMTIISLMRNTLLAGTKAVFGKEE